MSFDIVVIRDPKDPSTDEAENIRRSLDEIRVPTGFKMEGGERKFTVMIKGTDNAFRMLLVIGPPLGSRDSYFHKDLGTWITKHFPEGSDYKPSGGGRLCFLFSDYPVPHWAAKFHDRSSGYGVFDSRLIAYQAAIAKRLGLGTMFEWRN